MKQDIQQGSDRKLRFGLFSEDGNTPLDLTLAEQIIGVVKVNNIEQTAGRYALVRTGDFQTFGVLEKSAEVGEEHFVELQVDREESKTFIKGSFSIFFVIQFQDGTFEDGNNTVQRKVLNAGSITEGAGLDIDLP